MAVKTAGVSALLAFVDLSPSFVSLISASPSISSMSKKQKFSPKNKYEGIFGTDGVRALSGKFPLTSEEIKKIGYVSGKLFLKETGEKSCVPKMIIGKDTRDSGDWIEKSLSCGLSASGCEALSCGVIPTSGISAILQEDRFLGGAVISASHNPPQFNGIKFFAHDGKKIPDSWERKIEKNLESLNAKISDRFQFRNYPEASLRYKNFLRNCLPSGFSLKGYRWVLDCANGSASDDAPDLFKFYDADIAVIHNSPDGKNINANCGTLHLESLKKKVIRMKADGGCAFDGDADRVMFVDENGEVLDGDYLIAMAADDLKNRKELKNNCVVATVMANYGFIQYMKKSGIRTVITPVGDRAVFEALESSGAVIGGEQSGHIIFKKFLSTGDGLLTALIIMNILKESGKKLSYFRKKFPKFPQILLNLKVKEKVAVEKLPAMKKIIKEEESKLKDRGRILVRYSGTEPLLRIMTEGPSLSEIRKIADVLSDAAQSELEVLAQDIRLL